MNSGIDSLMLCIEACWYIRRLSCKSKRSDNRTISSFGWSNKL